MSQAPSNSQALSIQPQPFILGYCTNVHAGTTLRAIQENLERHAIAVRDQLGSNPMGRDQTLGVGLWIPASAALELMPPGETEKFGEWLAERKLVPYTFNGFPYDNFHTPVVKRKVYLPTWAQPERLAYTQQLIEILHRILPAGRIGSISTLPLGWGDPMPDRVGWSTIRAAFQQIAGQLRELEESTGRWINVAIEPEPGCVLQDKRSLVQFFEQYLPEPWLRRYITVCHDICHSAVMHESQAETLQAYRDAGILVGKVQVSSAISVPWEKLEVDQARKQLSAFAEDRYLHQTGVKDARGAFQLYEDLPQRLALPHSAQETLWRIHFHMPIHLARFGALETTQPEILECLSILDDPANLNSWTGHVEVETYAWTVLPVELRPERLSDGIAAELSWLRKQLKI